MVLLESDRVRIMPSGFVVYEKATGNIVSVQWGWLDPLTEAEQKKILKKNLGDKHNEYDMILYPEETEIDLHTMKVDIANEEFDNGKGLKIKKGHHKHDTKHKKRSEK